MMRIKKPEHDYIRSYFAANSSRILFDYADIFCWNNSGGKFVTNWNDGGTIRPHSWQDWQDELEALRYLR